MLLAQALYPAMIERGSGHLVFVSSLSGKAASPRPPIYNATKFGLRGFALGLRADLGPQGIGVSMVSPGFIREAGMFADSGGKTPPAGLGTSTPEQVGPRTLSRSRPTRSRSSSRRCSSGPGPLGLVSPEDGRAGGRRSGRAEGGGRGRRRPREEREDKR